MCIFCKIAAKELSCFKIYEDENYLGFLDLEPKSNGHSLVIPKKHYENVWDFKEEGSYLKAIQNVSIILRDKLEIEDLKIVQNNGEYAGQEVLHIHAHLIPYYQEKETELPLELVYKKFSDD